MRRHRTSLTLSVLSSTCLLMGLICIGGCSRGDAAAATGSENARLAADVGGDDLSLASGDLDHGRQLFMTTCASCHGATAQGLPHQGANLRNSKFVAGHSDDQLVNFIRSGRKPEDAGTVEGLPMPPRGGNPQLDDEALHDIVAYLRLIQKGFSHGAAAVTP